MRSNGRGFLGTISRVELISLGGLILLSPFFNIIRMALTLSPIAPAYVGVFLPVILNVIGSASGIAIIGRSLSGASVKTPSIVLKGIIGIVICEANLVFSLLIFVFLKEKSISIFSNVKEIETKHICTAWVLFTSGLISGTTGLSASLGSSIASSASNIAISCSSKHFSKLISLQLIIGGLGGLGLIIALVLLRLCCE
ncbi:V-type H+-transporting ATPase 21kDa proteolipid subunit [Nematocida sp. LUAm3]|nr:V-type H+-transporting ATPase 21kDa proteolipid subunit [Nematocida sp. LUAm3]KAI5175570.1 V-type H+-transporting ATPase 21kDa proteolipid subunit [Nematocida sp. LUAm2]KAI5178400.1 V-type H+-transporting ATPase 21kDa proteolipid subunit [Nematocida sp. LUAm1]